MSTMTLMQLAKMVHPSYRMKKIFYKIIPGIYKANIGGWDVEDCLCVMSDTGSIQSRRNLFQMAPFGAKESETVILDQNTFVVVTGIFCGKPAIMEIICTKDFSEKHLNLEN